MLETQAGDVDVFIVITQTWLGNVVCFSNEKRHIASKVFLRLAERGANVKIELPQGISVFSAAFNIEARSRQQIFKLLRPSRVVLPDLFVGFKSNISGF